MATKDKQVQKFIRRMAFSKLVDLKKTPRHSEWTCCGEVYQKLGDLHKHLAQMHARDIEDILLSDTLLLQAKWKAVRSKISEEVSEPASVDSNSLPVSYSEHDEYPWLPLKSNTDRGTGATVLLFYKYTDLTDPHHVCEWQRVLCKRLNLTGKIRIAKEGINATVAGTTCDTEAYKTAFMAHSFFNDMTVEEFKESPASGNGVFPDGLKVGVYQEICPMGVDPSKLTVDKTAVHLAPDEFHEAIDKHISSEEKDSIVVDCRNFYESKIGRFSGALAPNIRKFSYWPEYVDKNLEMFRNKDVYMYCTGGIRCERGSAYLNEKGICKNVFQLQGGIHKYIEQFPEGHYRGKLFVFDNRYTIQSNEDVLSECIYCGSLWDKYEPCRTEGCYQLVLSCEECRQKGHDRCCTSCHVDGVGKKEQCTCTETRERIPLDVNSGK
ncbi:hypothetical protein CAPTEDRAFT_225819 [Capitella teleta]|uniref:Thiosulfate sulfurtransferase/rhodanese-like domain-containing protein 2 n=1 Tax=Capitella teleta TaxID=283909 RepID=R7UF16_CAPTE|nr:hypothetical protein CAPTEDRAFT_225819 [Capitella teleta]|eukprot:ELU04564.1 hypothetical protein CAPTEDRAFT_225819 [Capitella teleta]